MMIIWSYGANVLFYCMIWSYISIIYLGFLWICVYIWIKFIFISRKQDWNLTQSSLGQAGYLQIQKVTRYYRCVDPQNIRIMTYTKVQIYKAKTHWNWILGTRYCNYNVDLHGFFCMHTVKCHRKQECIWLLI